MQEAALERMHADLVSQEKARGGAHGGLGFEKGAEVKEPKSKGRPLFWPLRAGILRRIECRCVVRWQIRKFGESLERTPCFSEVCGVTGERTPLLCCFG